MGKGSDWWFRKFSDDWADPSTVRGFFGGLLQAVLFFLLYLLLLLLWPEAVGPLTEYSTIGILCSGLGGVAVGGGLAYVARTRKRFRERWRRLATTLSTRLLFVLGALGGYWLLLIAGPGYGLVYACAYLVSRVTAVIGLYVLS